MWKSSFVTWFKLGSTSDDDQFPFFLYPAPADLVILLFSYSLYATKYSRIDQVKFFKGCYPQILLGPFLNTLPHLLILLLLLIDIFLLLINCLENDGISIFQNNLVWEHMELWFRNTKLRVENNFNSISYHLVDFCQPYVLSSFLFWYFKCVCSFRVKGRLQSTRG